MGHPQSRTPCCAKPCCGSTVIHAAAGWRKLLWSYPSPLLLIQGMLALGTLRRSLEGGCEGSERGSDLAKVTQPAGGNDVAVVWDGGVGSRPACPCRASALLGDALGPLGSKVWRKREGKRRWSWSCVRVEKAHGTPSQYLCCAEPCPRRSGGHLDHIWASSHPTPHLPTPPSFLTTSSSRSRPCSGPPAVSGRPFVDSSCCWGSRAEEEEGQPGQAGERQQEPQPYESKEAGTCARDARASSSNSKEPVGPVTSAAHLGTLFSLPVHAEGAQCCLCVDESFTEPEHWGQCAHTPSPYIQEHTDTHTDPHVQTGN